MKCNPATSYVSELSSVLADDLMTRLIAEVADRSDGGRVLDAFACPPEPFIFRELVYKVFSFLKREADVICILSPRALAFVHIGHVSLFSTCVTLFPSLLS